MSPSSTPAEGSGPAERPRVGYLGPEGTFTEEALLASAQPDSVTPVALRTIYDTVLALARGEVEWAVVPIENSLDGSVSVTLDLLGSEESSLEIVGEAQLSVRHSLIAGVDVDLAEIETLLTHPQVPGQCERFLRGELAHATVLAASSTAEAVRTVVTAGDPRQAALGTVLAAEIYGGTVLREGVQDRDDNETRFVWLARSGDDRLGSASAGLGVRADTGAGSGTDIGTGTVSGEDEDGTTPIRAAPPLRAVTDHDNHTSWKTSLVFWGSGADSPGWLVRCLNEFGGREINLTKIESRPKRERMGSYMFFVDLQGRLSEEPIAEAVLGLREICEQVRVLGSYRASVASADTAGEADGSPQLTAPAQSAQTRAARKQTASSRHNPSAPSLHSGATDG
jgi:prephenate dehydratase